MQSEVQLEKNHTISHWNIDGIDILYSERRVGEEMRGGMPMCAPMFSVQQRAVVGCDLPIHGILMYDQSGMVTSDDATHTVTTKYTGNGRFVWSFVAITEVVLDDNSLTHTFTITRALDCKNPAEMPLSLGLHPYFATHKQDFELRVGEKHYTKDTLPKNIIGSEFARITSDTSALLTTAHGTITITPKGYDEYCIWTDGKENYICIEPIYQYREFGLPHTGLKPGESKEVRCVFVFEPNS